MEDYINIESDVQFQTLKDCDHFEYVNILSSAKINDFSKLKYFKNVERLFLIDNSITDLSPLQDLHKLRILNISGTAIEDLSPLAHLENLEIIDASNTPITDLSPLSNKLCLTELFLNNCPISDLSSLQNTPELNWLEIAKSSVEDLSPLTELKKLKTLNISNTPVEDISCLESITSLSKIESEGLEHLQNKSSFVKSKNELIRPTEDYKEFFDLLLEDCPRQLQEKAWPQFQNRYDQGFYCAFLEAMETLQNDDNQVMLRVDWKASNEVLGQLNKLLHTHGFEPFSPTYIDDSAPIDDQLKTFANWLLEKEYTYLDWDIGSDEYFGFIVRAEDVPEIINISQRLGLQISDLSCSSQNADLL